MELMMQEVVEKHEQVSALADGQLRGEDFARTLEWLGQDEDARLIWQAYHVVGEVLRTGESGVRTHDAAFLQRLKLGLRQEAPLSRVDAINLGAVCAHSTGAIGQNGLKNEAANDARFRWRLSAGLASLALVSMVGWLALGNWREQSMAQQLAQTQAAKPAAVQQQVLVGVEPQLMIRDPQLDALLAAHRQAGGTSALQVPTGFLRNATYEGAPR
jgi:sigma-E factor negative regulatory protein RseA